MNYPPMVASLGPLRRDPSDPSGWDAAESCAAPPLVSLCHLPLAISSTDINRYQCQQITVIILFISFLMYTMYSAILLSSTFLLWSVVRVAPCYCHLRSQHESKASPSLEGTACPTGQSSSAKCWALADRAAIGNCPWQLCPQTWQQRCWTKEETYSYNIVHTASMHRTGALNFQVWQTWSAGKSMVPGSWKTPAALHGFPGLGL